jgi:hypothetical protein
LTFVISTLINKNWFLFGKNYIFKLGHFFFSLARKEKKKKKNDKNDNFDSIDEEHAGNGKARTPLYDELSIPFIDASLPPTPKMGRSMDQLAFLLGNARGSKSSLSSKLSRIHSF